ncbi:hypothetical protein J2752_001942 [Halarchaeum rubridurum]|uniref:Uncharacterized protein n=1 Tax=Halarchaeum rubridurum TaxID=489911 RepID=A0A830G0L8_9EURY|nr:hypothetical protein [Halarchaeum rubridurum]MBP1955030.1 hypothetical protein [Halarchaeum rubridurum]GGM69548.1 hypothetical protein GCM10009017_19630 [Halarchaeum rubridurum]
MLFDQPTRRALRDAGVSTDTLRDVEKTVAREARETATDVSAFFADHETVYSDMEQTHSNEAYPEHDVDYCDLFTHSQDVRGFLRFDTWGVYVEGARTLDDGTVELELGPTVHDRVRFAPTRDALE